MFHRAYEIQQRIDELEEKGAFFYPKSSVTLDEYKEYKRLSQEAHRYYMKDSKEWFSNRKQGILTGVLLVVLIESIVIEIITILSFLL